jgi:hypothetical protein
MIDIGEDLEDCLSTDELCETVTVGADSFAVFWLDDTAEGGSRGGPTALAARHALPSGIDEGQTLVRGTTSYKIMQIIPNGWLADLVLRA